MKALTILLLLSAASAAHASATLQNEFMSASRKGEIITLTTLAGTQRLTIDLPGLIQNAQASSFKDARWGAGNRLTVRHGDSTTTLTLYDGNPFAHFETRVGSGGEDARDINKLIIAKMELDLGIDPHKLVTLGTGGRYEANSPTDGYAYSVLADPETRNGVVCGWLTQYRGVGLMLPTFNNGKHGLETQLDFGLMRVQPGQTRETDILVVGFFDDARLGLENYAENIAKAYDIKLPPKPNVYCTWYHRQQTGSGASTEKMIAENAAFAKEHLKPFGLDVLQIDDNWQALENDPGKKNKGPNKTFISTTPHFPSGMAKTADTIEQAGFTPGIWFMPFAGDTNNPTFDPAIFATDKTTGKPFEEKRWSGATIDASSPQGEAFLRERFKRIHDWDFRYIKVDGLHVGAPSPNIYVNRTYKGKVFADAEIHDNNMTFIEAYRKGLGILREEFPDTFILGCAATQNYLSLAPVFGKVDAMRVGPDNGGAVKGNWKQTIDGADFAGNFWFLNNRVWYNDPDPIYVRESVPLCNARWMASWLAVSGAMHTTSVQYGLLAPERLDIIKRTLPAHNLNTLPVDILENKHPQIWKVANDRLCLLGLFNWNEKEEAEISYPLERIGLDSSKSYDAFDFWENKYLGTVKGSLSTTLAGAHCQVLALRETADHPQLLSTSRHITQGLTDVVSETWNAKAKTLSGTSQVVAGDPYELRITCPDGCKAKKIEVSDNAATTSNIEQSGNLVRVIITPSNTRRLDWKIVF
ncbi:Alpha-galactosidase [Pontiella desulfatans]|uniref:Alpha-galactosidase n=1 Tax=Pontiella desulfatans TaxID=2750659 RepID=A0A6C2U633_PONDE|nr:hypothetical protein [Pontiella desulfatans]VGO15375.1 Alpha-galactosidase [Pontiella desulfatans]